MDGSSLAGNPSTVSSGSLPVSANDNMLQPSDWISAPEEGDGQSKESVSLPRSQRPQSLVEIPQHSVEGLQSPAKTAGGPIESLQSPAEDSDQLCSIKFTNHETGGQKVEVSSIRPEEVKPCPCPIEKQEQGGSPATDQNGAKDSFRKDQKKLGTLIYAKHDNCQQLQVLTNHRPGENPPAHLSTQQTLPPLYQNPQQASFPVSLSGEPKLCGFLLKQGGPLRSWKLRWFMYEDKKNQLFYYRTPQDVMPLGRVELCSATFTYPLKAEKGTFHIKTPERTFILKVGVLLEQQLI